MKKADFQAKVDAVMIDCYNLLLNPDIKDEERALLLHSNKKWKINVIFPAQPIA
ncbi:hypothetical protein [Streptococcus henryi]|uniref:hypothetical protein n=1 Tax=Streptococcus henryi TaxID=439219 RepID=UPI0003A4CD8E|nr:hypothetical protein [Streptococcus henryi]